MTSSSEFDFRASDRSFGATMRRVGRYLSTRSKETWVFFAAGLVLGAFFL
jgi:hypothetical protein